MSTLLARGYCQAVHPADGVDYIEIRLYEDGRGEDIVEVFAREELRDDIESLSDFLQHYEPIIYSSLEEYRQGYDSPESGIDVEKIWPEETE